MGKFVFVLAAGTTALAYRLFGQRGCRVDAVEWGLAEVEERFGILSMPKRDGNAKEFE